MLINSTLSLSLYKYIFTFKRYIKLYLAINLLIISATSALSQKYNYEIYTRFINYTSQEGLCNNRINDIAQDSRGFIWFATENGLSRFDGYSFTNYKSNPYDSISIPGNVVTTLTMDGNENLWIGTTVGLCKLSLNTGEIKRFLALSGRTNSPRTNHIRKLFYSKSYNTLWVETLEGTLTSYNLSTNIWEHFSHTAINQPYYRYHAIFEDRDGNIWFGGRSSPVMKFEINRKTIKYYQAKGFENQSKRDNDVGDILQSSHGDWFVVGLDGIYQFFPETEKFTRLHSSSTYSIAEDSNGIIWFGTGNGLLSYNPTNNHFTVFQNNQYNSLSLVNNHVNVVFIDRDENVWAGTRNGVSLLSHKNSLFTYYYNIPNNENSLSSNHVTALAQDENGSIFIGTANHGLNKLKQNESKFEQFKSKATDKCSLASDRISTLYFDKKGTLWVGLWAGVGMNSLPPKNNCFTKYAFDHHSFKSDWYNSFLETSNGEFIVGLWGATGATYFDRATGKFTKKHFLTYEKPYRFPINQIIHDGLGTFFFLAHPLKAIYRFDSHSNSYSSHHHLNFKNEHESITNNLPFDFSDLLCMATNGKGLTTFGSEKGIIAFQKGKDFYSFFQGEMNPISLALMNDKVYILEKNKITAVNSNGSIEKVISVEGNNLNHLQVTENGEIVIVDGVDLLIISSESNDSNNCQRVSLFESVNSIHNYILHGRDIYFGTQNGLYIYNLDSLKCNEEFHKHTAIKVFDFPTSSLISSGENSILSFTPIGIFEVSSQTKKYRQIVLNSNTMEFNTAVNTVCMVSADTVWVGNESGHFQIIVSEGKVIPTNTPGTNRVSSHLVSTLMEDHSGNIWVGTTDKGLNKIDRKTGIIKHFSADNGYESLPGNTINSTLKTTDERIWVATNNGLCYIDYDSIYRIDGLIENQEVFSLQKDSQGLIWAAFGKGLACLNPNSGNFLVLDESTGVPSIDFSMASIVLKNGHLAWGTNNGFFIFDPISLNKTMDYGGDVWLTQFSIFDQPQNYNFSNNDTIKLHHTQNFFQISFSAADFGTKPGTKFRYKLGGIDPQWVETASNRAAYTNVPPGKYLFEVTKVLSNGNILSNRARLLIVIPPPFWKTLWFRGLIILLILSTISAYLITYIRQLKADKLNVQLEQRLLTSQMNPHFIFNSLSAIQSFMYSNNPEEAGNYLSSFSRLVRLILENSRSEFISINQEVKTLELYLTLQKLRFPDKFDFQIDVSSQVVESNILMPPMLAQPFIENSIEHGILHKEGKGFILVSINLLENTVCITIEDDGIGVEKSISLNLSKRLSHTSYATSITRERIKNISYGGKGNFGITIVDLKTEGKQGTRVELRFPVRANSRM
jgi:ligand-binding sensor domain-containing protein